MGKASFRLAFFIFVNQVCKPATRQKQLGIVFGAGACTNKESAKASAPRRRQSTMFLARGTEHGEYKRKTTALGGGFSYK